MIPVLSCSGDGLAQAWENSMIELFKNGARMKTQYDKPDDPPSYDATMGITIHNPLGEPMIHKDFPGGPEDLQEYVMEVCEGTKDHLVRKADDAKDTRWEYTYHQRLFAYSWTGVRPAGPSANYDGWYPDEPMVKTADQIEIVATKLAAAPHTRRAQAVTWKVWEDNECYDPACLQSIWCRITEEGGVWHLNTNVRFRSNDGYKAAFMNMFALTMLQKMIAARVAQIAGREVRLGRYFHMADSYHLYGSYLKEFEGRFMGNLQRRTFWERVANYSGEGGWKEMMDEAIPALREKAKAMQ
jgi:thymidylate synthase